MRSLKLLSPLIFAIALSGCGVNPVTGKRELQFVSEAKEIQIGEANYAMARQGQGGDMTLLPELTAYVNEVGKKLTAVADRQLPYEFEVLNSSVPNAWALPGGKIAVNRGLLVALTSEAELAAVLGHEIVHAAARHGAKAQERGTLLQGAVALATVGAAVAGSDPNIAGMFIQGAGASAALVQSKYGRDQELESDLYGTTYMKRAGYDPTGAVTLQETFVRLFDKGGKEQSWLDGLFASHPPSTERVEKNKQTAARLGPGGDLGKERYLAKIAPLMKAKPAYDKYDAAIEAMGKQDLGTAKALAAEAAGLEPREGRFQELLGEIALEQKDPKAAVGHYEKAMALNPNYFGSYLGAGIAQAKLGNQDKAFEWLTKSSKLLPTAPAAYYLGNIARDRGDRTAAMQYYQSAASSQSGFGKQAAEEFVRMDLPGNAAAYIATGGQVDPYGRVVLLLQNRSPVDLANIEVTPLLVDAAGRARTGSTLRVRGPLKAGEQVSVATGIAGLSPEALQALRFRIESARVAEK
jgi:predicted Zn-dependent protease